MAKKDRFPDAYSGGFPSNEESGCSGRNHNETSGYENSSGQRKKWIKLSSAMHDGFGVPIRSVPMSTLASSEKQKWLIRLRSELDQIRTFQKKVDVEKSHVTMSSSSNIIRSNNVQTNMRKLIDPQAQKASSLNRGVAGRVQSVNVPAVPDTFSLLLRKQCENLLKKVMTHQHGWVFNKPVDVVALKLPDYFNVIKKPMDLGTIKEKLLSGNYSSPFQFVADVRLTFSNAMTYNPPGNDVHIMADVLSKFFELRWKPIEKKLPVNVSERKPVHEEIDLVKPMPPSKKRKMTSVQPNLISEPVKPPVMTIDEKHNLSRELETHLGDLPDNIIDFLRKHGSNRNEGGEDEIEIDINDLNDEILFELRKMVDDHIREKQNQNQEKAEPCVIELRNESGLSNSSMQLYKGNDEDLDVAGNEPPVSSYPPNPIELDKETNKTDNKATSNDSDSSSASENQLKDVKASTSFNEAKETGTNDSAEKRPVSGSEHAEQKPNSIESDSQKDDGDSAPNDKLYRAALLKNRFADTIFKAREKTLNQDEKAEVRREVENQRKKEKARLEAEAKAAEDAKRRVEEEAAAEAKRKRDVEREAAREALMKMEKTVEIDETSRFLKDLDMLRAADHDQLLLPPDNSPQHESSPDGLGSFNFRTSNPLEQLGLYMKRDEEHEEDQEEEVDPTTVTTAVAGDENGKEIENENGVVNNDVEEGEIN